jgi:hypothetical protein
MYYIFYNLIKKRGKYKMFEELYTEGKYLEGSPNWYAEDSPWKAKQILK